MEKAGGRVELTWPGKRPGQIPAALPDICCREIYGANGATPVNRLLHGDNLLAMTALRSKMAGKIALIYLDPPFFTGQEWEIQGTGDRGQGAGALSAFSDAWGHDLGAYLQWLVDRLTLARELLAETGCLYLHLNWHAAHYAKLLLDEIFSVARFQNEIVWCYREAINSRKRWNRKHDTILFYSKGARFTFNPEAVMEPYAESNIKKYRLHDEKGAYRLMGRGIANSPLRSRRDLPPSCETEYPGLTYRHYLGEGTLPVDHWQIDIENQASATRTGYPTQKPEALLERIILASTHPGDLIADFCCGSGTTLAVAERLGRRWLGCDSGALAVHTTRKRLLGLSPLPAFSVEAVGEKLSPSPEETSGAIIVQREGNRVALRLTEEWAARADMWAVEWPKADTSDRDYIQPDWWSARTRHCPHIVVETPQQEIGPTGQKRADRATALLAAASGEAHLVQIPLE